MKQIPSLLLGVLCALLVLPSGFRMSAQNGKPPTQFTYQGFLTDANGVPFGNTAPVNKTVIFRIYDALTGGTLKWSSQQVVTVDKGYFSVLLGQGSSVGTEPFSANLTGVFTGSTASDRYLELTADGTTIAPRMRFLPAPYALLATSATELLDPSSGSSSLSVSGGNISSSGSLTVSSISTSGNISSSGNITASGSITATGNVTASGTITSGNALKAPSHVNSHGQGAYIEWNKDNGGGMSYLLNQRGKGGGGIVLGEVSSENAITENMRITSAGNVGIGTTSPSSKLEVNGAIAATSFSGHGTIPLGGIIMWSGSTVPDGWALCDGSTSNGRVTPNLRDRFIVGSGGTYATGATGGKAQQTLAAGNLPSFSIPPFSITIALSVAIAIAITTSSFSFAFSSAAFLKLLNFFP